MRDGNTTRLVDLPRNTVDENRASLRRVGLPGPNVTKFTDAAERRQEEEDDTS